MWQPGWEGSLGENEHMYMYGWVPLLTIWSYHNIVNWLYTSMQNKKNKSQMLSKIKPHTRQRSSWLEWILAQNPRHSTDDDLAISRCFLVTGQLPFFKKMNADFFLPDLNHLSLTKIFQVWPLPELYGYKFMTIRVFSGWGGVGDGKETIRWDLPWFLSSEGISCFRSTDLGSGSWRSFRYSAA